MGIAVDYSTLIAFVITTVLMDLTPGPAVLKVIGDSMGNGWRPAQASVAGILSANVMYCLLSVAGLNALILAVPFFFEAIKWVGVAYLVWIGLQSIHTAWRAADSEVIAAPRVSAKRLFRSSFILQGANPKSVLYFAAILPAFAGSGENAVQWMLIFGALSIILEYAVLLLYSLLGGQIAAVATRASIRRVLNALAGATVVGAAAMIARASYPNR